jgi:hypothetical protein
VIALAVAIGIATVVLHFSMQLAADTIESALLKRELTERENTSRLIGAINDVRRAIKPDPKPPAVKRGKGSGR